MKKAKEKSPFYNLSKTVSDISKKDILQRSTIINHWAIRYSINSKIGRYDIAFEYMAVWDLLQVKTAPRFYKLYFWKCFVRDFRRAYSDYEFKNFQSAFK